MKCSKTKERDRKSDNDALMNEVRRDAFHLLSTASAVPVLASKNRYSGLYARSRARNSDLRQGDIQIMCDCFEDIKGVEGLDVTQSIHPPFM